MTKTYTATALIGGGNGALDKIPGSDLSDKDACRVIAPDGVYAYSFDDDIGGAEDSPFVITPNTDPGNGRWLLQSPKHLVYDVWQSSGKFIATDKIRAVDGTGLSLVGSAGSGIFVDDAGHAKIDAIAAGASDYDKHLVSDGGVVKYRTDAQVRNDLNVENGAAADQTGIEIVSLLEALAAGNRLSHDNGLKDISANDHHNQSHVLDGGDHTISGKTPGHFLRAFTATTFGFAAHGLGYGDVGAEQAGISVLEADFNATTFMYALANNTPLPKTPAEVMAILSGQAAAAFSFNGQNLTGVGTIACGAITAIISADSSSPVEIIATANPTYHFGQLAVTDDTALAANIGGLINFKGNYSGTNKTEFAAIQGYKINVTDGNYAGGLKFFTRAMDNIYQLRAQIDDVGNIDIIAHNASTIGLKLGGTLVTASAAEINERCDNALAPDHGAAATDMLVNVCYGTGSPPTANTTTIGTLWVKYTA